MRYRAMSQKCRERTNRAPRICAARVGISDPNREREDSHLSPAIEPTQLNRSSAGRCAMTSYCQSAQAPGVGQMAPVSSFRGYLILES
jgi:hypothetical protein